MKTTIMADGTLYIEPEGDLEAYARGKWSKENIHDWFAATKPNLKIIIDLEAYPAALGVLTVGGLST